MSGNSPRSLSQGAIPKASSRLCSMAVTVLYLEAEERSRARSSFISWSEELICIQGKIWLGLGLARVLYLSLGIVAARLLWWQFRELLANTGDSRWKELGCVVFLHFCFSHFRVNLRLWCGSENLSSHSHIALNKSSCHILVNSSKYLWIGVIHKKSNFSVRIGKQIPVCKELCWCCSH